MPFFRYRSLDELRADVAARGVDVEFTHDMAPLRQPLAIGQLELSNRLVVHPMEGCDANADGTPGELTFRRWRRFAEGGASLLWGEATAVVPEGRANPRQLLISHQTAPELRRLLAETVEARRRRYGTADGFVVGLQLTHSGRWSYAGPLIVQHGANIDAVRHCGDVPLLSDAELDRIADAYVRAATLARDVGFQFIDIKQCHTYLLNELLGARTREGLYGGSYENRTRLVKMIFSRVRDALGDSMVLATRMNIFDSVPYVADEHGIGRPASHGLVYEHGWGTSVADPTAPDLTEPIRLIAELRALGLALVNVSMGSPYYNPHIGRPFERAPVDGYAPPEHPLTGVERHMRLTRDVQKASPDLAIVGTGYSWLRHYAVHAGAANVAGGRVTLVGLGRGALAYHDFAHDALYGRGMEANKACIGVSYCTALMRAKHNDEGQYPTGCVPRDAMYAEQFKAARHTEGW